VLRLGQGSPVAGSRYVLRGPRGALSGDIQQLRWHLWLSIPIVGSRGGQPEDPCSAVRTCIGALPGNAGLPEERRAPLHPPRRRGGRGQHRGARRARGHRGAGGERQISRASRFRPVSQDGAARRGLPLIAQDRLGPQGATSRHGGSAPAVRRRADRALFVRDRRDDEGHRRDLEVAT